jgi:hypothetical protein
MKRLESANTLAYRVISVLKDGVPRSSSEIAKIVQEDQTRTRKTLVNLCLEDCLVSDPIRFSMTSHGREWIDGFNKPCYKNRLSKRVGLYLQENDSISVVECSENMGVDLTSARAVLRMLRERNRIVSRPVLYTITDGGRARIGRPTVRYCDERMTIAEDGLIANAIAKQPLLMRAWG